MKRIDLNIYREYYQDSALTDIWDKITNVLEDHGMPQAGAEYIGLLITEWIRSVWRGCVLVERRRGDSKDISRFNLLRDRAISVLAETSPKVANHMAVAVEVTRVIRADYLRAYIPRIKKMDQMERDIDIYNLANSAAQMEAMAVKHNISLVRAYQINAEQMKIKQKREQPELPF